MSPNGIFPSSDFDHWAATYDQDVVTLDTFPFAGYERALETVVEWAAPSAGMRVLDIGTGTGNLALRFAEHGCQLWCTDFSEAMLAKAREKLPAGRLVLHDLGTGWPSELDRRFDRIVSAYVFHHCELSEKVRLVKDLVSRHLTHGGRVIMADLSFPDKDTMQAFAQSIGNLWEDEQYWLVDESIGALREAGLRVQYTQVSGCAGVYRIESQ